MNVFRRVRKLIRDSQKNWVGDKGVAFISTLEGDFRIEWNRFGKIIYRSPLEVSVGTVRKLQEEVKRLTDLCKRWEHMIDPNTDPGGCSNCFHQEFEQEIRRGDL